MIQDVPLDNIHIDRKLFQGREKAFSKRSVDNIITDALEGRFIWENLDPITLWKSPGGKLFLLAGHSRYEAFKMLSKEGIKVDGKSFDKIPAKIRTGSLEAAKSLALDSNTLSTKETDIERATYYRRLRQEGTAENKLIDQIKKNEGRNWTNILAYTYLNPNGDTWAALRQFAGGEETSSNITKSLAKWIGTARNKFPMLTNMQENEVYSWLFGGGYGSGSSQVANERDFLEKIAVAIQKNTVFGEFEADKPLNILRSQQKSPSEMEFDKQLNELTRDILATDKELKDKIKSLAKRSATAEQVRTIVAPLEASLRNKRAVFARLQQKRSEVIEHSKNEATLFGINGRKRLLSNFLKDKIA